MAEASENIPFHEDATPEGMDRVRFAILKRIKQGRKNEESAFEDAKCDWRDLFVSAGFANSATAHDSWYEVITNKKSGYRADGPNPYAFGTSGMSAAEQPWMPEASRDRSSGTLGQDSKTGRLYS